jgi:acyl carrier protein
MVQSLAEHLERWASISTKHGLIILEVHCLEPDVISTFLDKSESLHFDAYHAFSRQHLVEADVFLAAAAEAGLFPKSEFFRKYPNTFPFSRITLNWFEKRPYTIRHPHLGDLPALVNLEAKCWPEPLRVSSNEIQQRLERFPNGQYILEIDGRVVGAIYSQRISRADQLENATFENVTSLQTPQGSIVQLLGLNILPEMRDMSLDDQILEFFLNWCALKGGIKGVVGVSWCKNYVFQPHVSLEEYLRKRTERGQLLDTVLYFYGHHNPVRSAILATRPEDRQQLLEDYFREQIARVLEVPESELNVHQRLIDLGLDSLMAMELEYLIKTDLGVEISMVTFLQGPSIAQLVTDVLHSLNFVTGNEEIEELGHGEEEFII